MKTLLLFLGLAASTLSHSVNPGPSPKTAFNINDYTWLVGSWEGDGFGGTSHETWAEPVNGTMMVCIAISMLKANWCFMNSYFWMKPACGSSISILI